MITHDRYQTAVYAGLWSVWTLNISAAVITPNLWFTLGNQRPEFTLPRAPDITSDDNAPEFTLENA